MKLLAAILSTFLMFRASASLIDYRLDKAPVAAALRECTKPGLLCESCTSLVACVDEGSGRLTKSRLDTCDKPSFCVGGVCTTEYDPVCAGTTGLAFPCRSVGIFPDPFYCDKFVLCAKATATTYTSYVNACEEGYGYNVTSDLCDVRLEDGECKEREYPVPLCESPGQSEALPGKPAMYYICEEYHNVLYPFLDVCPHGDRYVNFTCGGSGEGGAF